MSPFSSYLTSARCGGARGSRGSGAGSLVAWSLTITDLDPIRMGLLFERFLNPERLSMPDFDIDFCETRRGEVIRLFLTNVSSTRVFNASFEGAARMKVVASDLGRYEREAWFRVGGQLRQVPTRFYDRSALKAGNSLEGPAIVHLESSTAATLSEPAA